MGAEHIQPQSDQNRSRAIRRMFAGISRRYDLLNRLMTFGRDQAWRRHLVKKAAPPPGGMLLDMGSGTGGIALEALCRDPTLCIVAADYTLEMMAVGRQRPGGHKILWCNADALHLPFPDNAFDAVTSGYLIRNVVDAHQAFQEQVRVTRPGGRVVCLDTSPPSPNLLRPFILFYLRVAIPLIGQVIGGNRAAYEYLPTSTQTFMSPDELALVMKNAGLEDIRYARFMLGTQVVVCGIKP